MVAFHRAYFPGYVATLDGKPIPVNDDGSGLIPMVRLPPGRHQRLLLSYRPRAVVWGATLSGVTLAALVFAALWLAGPDWPRSFLRAQSGSNRN